MPRTKGTAYVTEIYQKLTKGLEGEDSEVYEQVLSEYGEKKGSFYRALSMVLADSKETVKEAKQREREMERQVKALEEKVSELQKQEENFFERINELKEKEFELNNKLEKLDPELEGKKELLKEVQNLEELGFSPEMLFNLYSALKEMEAERGFNGKEALSKFFEELKDYDRKRGFEIEATRSEKEAEEKGKRKEEVERELERLERRYKSRKGAVDALEDLRETYNVKEEQIVSWSLIVWDAGGGIKELEKEIQEYGDLEKAVKAKREKLERIEAEIKQEQASLDEIKSEQGEIRASIKALTDSGIEEVKRVGEDIKKWGELMKESGKLESEIELGRYFQYSLEKPELAGNVPIPVLFSFLEILEGWLRARKLNPEIAISTPSKVSYPALSQPRIALLTLILLVRKGFEEVRE